MNPQKERSPRVLQVIAAVSPDFGGPSIGAVELNRAMRREGSDALILTTDARRAGGSMSGQEISTLSGADARIRAHAVSAPARLRNSWGLARDVVLSSAQVDLIHIHGQYLLPNVYAYLAARLRRIRYGVQPHGGLEPYQREKSKLIKSLYGRLIGDRIIRNATYILFASESEADRATDLVRPDQRIVSPLGATLAGGQPVDAIDRWLEGVPRNKVVVYLGRLAKKKRPDLLLREWAAICPQSTGARLVIAGPDDDLTAEELRALSGQLGIADSVLVPGPLDAEQKSWLLRRARVFALPSENENFGVAVAEAMLAGMHCIVTREVAASEHVERSLSGEVVDNAEEFRGALRRALLSEGDPSLLDGKARQYAEEELSWSKLANLVLKMGTYDHR